MDLHYTEPADNTIANPSPTDPPAPALNTRGFVVNNSFWHQDRLYVPWALSHAFDKRLLGSSRKAKPETRPTKTDLTQLPTRSPSSPRWSVSDDPARGDSDGLGGSVQLRACRRPRSCHSDVLLSRRYAELLSCDITPEGTKELITSNADGNNYMDNLLTLVTPPPARPSDSCKIGLF